MRLLAHERLDGGSSEIGFEGQEKKRRCELTTEEPQVQLGNSQLFHLTLIIMTAAASVIHTNISKEINTMNKNIPADSHCFLITAQY